LVLPGDKPGPLPTGEPTTWRWNGFMKMRGLDTTLYHPPADTTGRK